MSNNRFHDHLDACWQCREHPHDLCTAGAVALREAALGDSGKYIRADGPELKKLLSSVRKKVLEAVVLALEDTCKEVLTMPLVPQGGPSETKRIRDAIHYGTLRALEDVRVLLNHERECG